MCQPSDAEIFRRGGRLVRSFCDHDSRAELGTLADLRRSCWVIARPNLMPVMARYADGEISCNSPARKELRRLFPEGKFIEFAVPSNTGFQQRASEPEEPIRDSDGDTGPSGARPKPRGEPSSSHSPVAESWANAVWQAAQPTRSSDGE